MPILNSFEVDAGLMTSGQPKENQFREISDAGYDCVINLAMPDHEDSIDNEGGIVTSLGMTYIHIPVPMAEPTVLHLEQFCGYMEAMRGRKVWVHCIVNARVSAFMFCYLQKYRGMSPEEAATPILVGWLPKMDEVWQRFISNAPGQL